MDASTLCSLENLLRFPGATVGIVPDASILSCGCLVSELQYLGSSTNTCPSCRQSNVHILKPVIPLRELYKVVQSVHAVSDKEDRLRSSRSGRLTTADSSRSLSSEMDLLGLFCKYAKEDQNATATAAAVPSSSPPKMSTARTSTVSISAAPNSAASTSPVLQKAQPVYHQTVRRQSTNQTVPSAIEDDLLISLDENEERNFSQCFPFHRMVSSFPTQSSKLSFSSRSLVKRTTRFIGSAMISHFDYATRQDITLFVLISDRKWELYQYSSTKPILLACGKSTGEYGPSPNALKQSHNDRVVRNEFGEKKSEQDGPAPLAARLKSSVQLYCCLSRSYLVIAGTQGVLRVLNVDPTKDEIGSPIYTYLTDFPIRCITLAPTDDLIACGITTREKRSGKQQPFIILHRLTSSATEGVKVTPITITVPYRDPLKILTFSPSATHLLCCTVYEMRYFIIRLRGEGSSDYRKPRLIFSDMRISRKPRTAARNLDSDESEDGVDALFESEDDDQMLDNEGITDLKFGSRFTNTIVITSSSMKNRPSIVLKLNGPPIDSRRLRHDSFETELHQDSVPGSIHAGEVDDSPSAVVDVEVVMKLSEIGSNVYRVEVSPRGDSMVFVDKSGRLLLVSTSQVNGNLGHSSHLNNTVVLLGEVSPALRYTEAASVCYSSDGGKIMAIDRKGVFQVFDFTRGIPGEDPEVIKCKIISL